MRLILFLIFSLSLLGQSPKSRKTSDPGMKQLLFGDHKLSLNWVELDTRTYGSATVELVGEEIKLFGQHRSPKNRDFLVIDGVITEITAKGFVFQGRLSTQVTYNFVGKVCERKGPLFFELAKDRQSWVLKETPPCGTHKDKVTFFLARP